jgi:hypothetical protein
MKAPRKRVVILAIVLWLVALLIIMGRSPLDPWLRLKNFERQIKANVDVDELEQWATNLMAQSYGQTWLEYHGEKFLKATNLPSGFKKVQTYRNGIHIIADRSHVSVFDDEKGGDFLVIEASPTSFTRTNQTVIQWKPGIYFVGGPLDWR